MSRIHHSVQSLGFLLVFLVGCTSQTKPQTFQNEVFSFTIPADWKIIEEVWNRPASSGQDYYGLGVQEVVTIQYPSIPGKGSAFFAVASSRLEGDQDLAARFERTYQAVTPQMQNVVKGSFTQGKLSGHEITYKRPWGEPWWQFRDIWLEKDSVVYVLSFHASPNSFDTYNDPFTQILKSFQFKD